MASPWSPPQHGVDLNGFVQSPSSPLGDLSTDSKTSRQRRTSSPGKRITQWFTRSRSASPSPNAENDPPSPSSFVVRSVVKQPGGVSHMKDVHGNQIPSHQIESRPLSLGVPPGGPGGGIGYGTALSSNDGRPENAKEERGRSRSKSPSRPASPGAITAGAFRSGGKIAPGPLSYRQMAEENEKAKQHQNQNQHRYASAPNSRDLPSSTPMGPRTSMTIKGTSPQQTSPLSLNQTTSPSPSRGYSMPIQMPRGVGAPPPVIPLDGIPSPVKIPYERYQDSTPSPQSTQPMTSVDSPGVFDFPHQEGGSGESPIFTSKWFKGLFNKSPRDYDDARLATLASNDSGLMQHSPNAWTDGNALAGRRLAHDQVEREALERKKHSMMIAARIEDEHRSRLINGEMAVNTPKKHQQQQHQQQQQRTPSSKVRTPQQIIDEAFGSQSLEWDPPLAKSPPGRKPVPQFTASDLEAMSEKERQEVAKEIDPNNKLSKLQDEQKLTPAQQIIADTRSKIKECDEKLSQGALPSLPSKTTAQNGQRQLPSKGLTAGTGPMPKDMPLPDALQEMMTRFYRFERYAVPLMRTFESRLVDVERDNQMALHADGVSVSSQRDQEMDKWVEQMTKVMQHEVKQLQIATLELRQGREALAIIAKSYSTHSTEDSKRRSNFSSSSFKSAVRKPSATVSATDNTSPNGRPRFTSALGNPMQEGKIHLVNVPEVNQAVSPKPSNRSLSSRSMSVDERLKALMQDKLRSPSISSQSQSGGKSLTSSHERDASAASSSDSSDTSFEKVMAPKQSRVGDDYQVVSAKDVVLTSSKHVQGASIATTIKPAVQSSIVMPKQRSMTLDLPSKNASSSGKISPNVTGNSMKLATTTRAGSVSPINRIPSSPSQVTTSNSASHGLRQRAQSYLQNTDAQQANAIVPAARKNTSSESAISTPLILRAKDLNGSPKTEMISSKSITASPTKERFQVDANKATNSAGLPLTPSRMSIKDRVAFFDAAQKT